MSMAIVFSATAQTKWHDASELTIIGKPIPTSKAFTRIDTSVYKFNDKTIDRYASYPTGLAIVFAKDLGEEHIATADGTHPTDLGFTHMLSVISPKIKKILKKYGIK